MAAPPGYYLGRGGAYWKQDGNGPFMTDEFGNISQGLPFRLFTDNYGPSARLRVDVGQTSFFAGKEFRTWKELSIAAGATYVIRAQVAVNTILAGLQLVLDNGFIRMGTYLGGAQGGSFSEVLPIRPRNNMSTTPVYVAQNSITAGGTHTGGTELDVDRVKVENSTGAAASVGNVPGDERGVAVGIYYFRLQNIGTGPAEGTFKASWEERP